MCRISTACTGSWSCCATSKPHSKKHTAKSSWRRRRPRPPGQPGGEAHGESASHPGAPPPSRQATQIVWVGLSARQSRLVGCSLRAGREVPSHKITIGSDCERVAATSCTVTVAALSERAAADLAGGELWCSVTQVHKWNDKVVVRELAGGSKEQLVRLEDVEAHGGVRWCEIRNINDAKLWGSEKSANFPEYQVTWTCGKPQPTRARVDNDRPLHDQTKHAEDKLTRVPEAPSEQRPGRRSRKSGVADLLRLHYYRGTGYKRF